MAPGSMQIIVIILLVMVLFGAGRIPNIMENVAKGVKSFKKGLKDEEGNSTASERKSVDETISKDKDA
jgi:sec-independent protein translocase protein TatA